MTSTTPSTSSTHAADAPPTLPRRSYTARIVLRVLGNWGAVIGLCWVAIAALAAVLAPLLASSHPLLWRIDGEWASPWLRHLSPVDVLLLGLALSGLLVLTVGRRAGAALIGGGICLGAMLIVGLVLTRWLPLGAYSFEFGFIPARTPAGPMLILLMAGLALLGAWCLRPSTLVRRVGVVLLALVVVLPAALWLIQPPRIVVHAEHREVIAEGRVDRVLMAPIPYSPTDRQRDRAGQRTRNLEVWWGPPLRAAAAAGWTGREAVAWSDADEAAYAAGHWMGTDNNGQDILSRMIHASRIALAIGFIATGIALAIGVVVGGLMGYFSGLADLLGMRLVEIFNAIPTLLLLIMFVAFFERNLYLMMVIIGITSWMSFALFTRAEFLRLRQQEFVLAAQAGGVPLWSILFKHMLPNGMAPILVTASFGIASAILAESILSYLGLGLIDEPSWGQMLSEATGPGGGFRWWIAMFPGMAIFLTVYAYNLIGEALRDAVDPRVVDDN